MKLIVRIRGGLGNQLFCYAAARRVALKNGHELVIDHVSGFSRDVVYRRAYRLDGFSISARLATPAERYEPFERVRRGIAKYIERQRPFEKRRYIEQEFPGFDPRLLNLKLQEGTTVIDGLWQSARYFDDIEETLRGDLRILPPVDKKNLDAHAWIKQNQAVAVHVRWFSSPDAVTGAEARVHKQYYRSALSILQQRIRQPRFAVFSDNPKAVAEILELPTDRTLLVDWNSDRGCELWDLWLMSYCQHFVLANSTFSWWGAWLGTQKKERLVLFPRCEPRDILGWGWDYEGQMPGDWIPVLIDL